jgi:hypothetical protein
MFRVRVCVRFEKGPKLAGREFRMEVGGDPEEPGCVAIEAVWGGEGDVVVGRVGREG